MRKKNGVLLGGGAPGVYNILYLSIYFGTSWNFTITRVYAICLHIMRTNIYFLRMPFSLFIFTGTEWSMRGIYRHLLIVEVTSFPFHTLSAHEFKSQRSDTKSMQILQRLCLILLEPLATLKRRVWIILGFQNDSAVGFYLLHIDITKSPEMNKFIPHREFSIFVCTYAFN